MIIPSIVQKPCYGRYCTQNPLYQELHVADEINEIIIDYLENASRASWQDND